MEIETARVRAVTDDVEAGLVDAATEAREVVGRSVDEGRELLVTRSADLRDALGDRAVVWGGVAKHRAADLAADLSGELEHRAGEWRDVVRSRARALEQDLPVDADDALAYAQMGGWQLVRGLIAVVAFLPRLVVRALGGLSRLVDRLAGVDVRARGRELAAAVPLPTGARRTSRRRTVLLIGIGAVIGFVGGVAASRRRAPIVTYDVPPNVPQSSAQTGAWTGEPTDGPAEAPATEVADLSAASELTDVATPDDSGVPKNADDQG